MNTRDAFDKTEEPEERGDANETAQILGLGDGVQSVYGILHRI